MEGALSRVHVAASLERVLYKLCMEKRARLGGGLKIEQATLREWERYDMTAGKALAKLSA